MPEISNDICRRMIRALDEALTPAAPVDLRLGLDISISACIVREPDTPEPTPRAA